MSLSKRDIELMQLGFKCFESPPKVNFEKLATMAGLKNASSAQTCYNGAKRKFLNGAAAAATTNAASLNTPSPTAPNPSPSAPASKKRKTSAKPTTGKPTKAKGGKPSTNAAKTHPTPNDDDDDDAFDADDDEEPAQDRDVKPLLPSLSDEAAAAAADMQLKFDDDAAHAVKHSAPPAPHNADRRAAATTNADTAKAKAKDVERTTVVKAEATDEEEGKAKELLRRAVQLAMQTSLGSEGVVGTKDAEFVAFGNGVGLSREEGSGGEVVGERGKVAGAQTGSGLVGAEPVGDADAV